MSARGTFVSAPLALFFALAAWSGDARANGAEEGRDRLLPGCGICYPGGYDVNTVGKVSGSVVEVQAPVQGPVRLVLAAERERWVVLASPGWFWESSGLRLAPGDPVRVQGSKTFGADSALYLVAREIWSSGDQTAVVFRDSRGIPLWGDGYRRGQLAPRAGDACSAQGLGGRRR